MTVHQCETWQMMESAKGGWYCGACGEHEAPAMTAAEKAMNDIGAALEEFYKSNITEWDFLNAVARVNGAYSVERIGTAHGND